MTKTIIIVYFAESASDAYRSYGVGKIKVSSIAEAEGVQYTSIISTSGLRIIISLSRNIVTLSLTRDEEEEKDGEY